MAATKPLLFALILILLEMAWMFVPDSIYWEYDVGSTAGILDNIPYALALFLLIPYSRTILKFASLVWLINETGDGALRGLMLYGYAKGWDTSILSNWLIFTGWIYLLVPVWWLYRISRSVIAKPSDPYRKENTYFYFLEPKNILELFSMNVFVVHHGMLYYFDDGIYSRREYSRNWKGRLVKIKPPKNFGKFLESRRGTKYNFVRNNCITVLRGAGLGIKKLDFVPAIFLQRYKE